MNESEESFEDCRYVEMYVVKAVKVCHVADDVSRQPKISEVLIT